jgi:hypothetical protein
MSREGCCVIKTKAFVALLAVLAAMLVVAFACGDNGEEPSPSPTAAATPTPTPSPSTELPFQFEGPIGIDLTTFGVFFEPGETIQLAIRIAVREPTTLYYRTSQRYDLAVVDSEGAEVWRWSLDRAFAQITAEESLDVGEILSFDEKWDQRGNDGEQAPVGNYQIVAESSHCDVNYENCGQLSTSATIQIRPSEEAP